MLVVHAIDNAKTVNFIEAVACMAIEEGNHRTFMFSGDVYLIIMKKLYVFDSRGRSYPAIFNTQMLANAWTEVTYTIE